mgnify:CR=1 FL=1
MSEILSALSDGQATPEEVARACAAWRDDAQTRASWHRYQLIGDAMRSSELLKSSDSSAFLQGFRERLAQEPVVLAPQAAHANHVAQAARVEHVQDAHATLPWRAPSLKRRPWAGPAAVAASFVMLVGLMASNLSGPGAGEGGGSRSDALASVHDAGWGGHALVASSWAPSQGARLQSVQSMGASFDSTDQTEGVLIRDPRVEPLLSLQRPMVIDPPAETFSEPGLRQAVGYSAP